METVVLKDLAKTYPGGKEAVKGISLSLRQGEVFGFLGPNGAGKTTTIKLLTGMLQPSAGRSRVMGQDPAVRPEKVHAASGVLTEHAQMYDHMTGLENLLFYGGMFEIPEGERRKRALDLLKKLELEEAADRKLSAYSTGMRQRLSLARAIIHRPRVLFLDEPTSGLDPESGQNVNRLIREMAQEEGTTVFLCTHQLRYAQEICTRYGLIDEGRLLAEGTLEELRKKVGTRSELRILAGNLPQDLQAAGDLLNCRWIREESESLQGRNEKECLLRTAIESREEIPGIVRGIIKAGGDIYEVDVRRPDLEDIYFALTAKRGEGES